MLHCKSADWRMACKVYGFGAAFALLRRLRRSAVCVVPQRCCRASQPFSTFFVTLCYLLSASFLLLAYLIHWWPLCWPRESGVGDGALLCVGTDVVVAMLNLHAEPYMYSTRAFLQLAKVSYVGDQCWYRGSCCILRV